MAYHPVDGSEASAATRRVAAAGGGGGGGAGAGRARGGGTREMLYSGARVLRMYMGRALELGRLEFSVDGDEYSSPVCSGRGPSN
jgi:hypothetical protein